jgi:anionic cell wall polymer biosynthesis LytR-Cps2A-Psr (LCP) family protein
MKGLILLTCFIVLFICKTSADQYLPDSSANHQKRQQVNSKADKTDKIIDLIANLPEVKEERKYFFKTTKRHIVMMVENEPVKNGRYYTISVVQDMIDHYFHLWYFNVDAKTHAISFWDIASDTMIPYAKWSKSLKTKSPKHSGH